MLQLKATVGNIDVKCEVIDTRAEQTMKQK